MLTKAGGTEDDLFGFMVAASNDGTTAFVTAPGVHNHRGAVDVFRVAGEGAWASSSAPTATLTNSGGHVGDGLGFGPVLSADGATALVGAPLVKFEIGAAYVFHVAGASSWASNSTPAAVLTDSALDQCIVPNLKGKTVPAAKSALKARSCRLGTVKRVVSAKGKRGRIVAQSRPAGSRSPVGTKVKVKIAK
jgi:hypothetical protein